MRIPLTVTSKMPKPYIKKKSTRKGKSNVPERIGYYTMRKACEILDVHPTSLRNTAARADSNSLWSNRGVSIDITEDQPLLIASQVKYGRHTYFKMETFDRFASIYMKKVSHILGKARRDREREIKKSTQTFVLNSKEDVEAYTMMLKQLFRIDETPLFVTYAPTNV